MGGGISLDLPFSENAGFRTGIFHARKGARFSEEIEEMSVSGGTYFDYIEVPALLRIGIPVEGGARPHFLLGPALAIKVSCSLEVDAGATAASVDCDDVDAPTGGFGIAITASRGVSIRLDALYSLGLRAVADGPEEKNRAITGQVGVVFPIG